MRYAHTPQTKSGGDGHTNSFAGTAEPGAVVVGGMGACSFPDFGTSLNSISTRACRGEGRFFPPNRFSDLRRPYFAVIK